MATNEGLATNITFTADELARSIVVTVRIKGLKAWAIRLQIAAWLMCLAARVAGMGIGIEREDEPPPEGVIPLEAD